MQNGRNSSGRENDGDRLPYRAGLDGLRALAVTGVFLYHANVSWMPGGFLGVDLFFVLSGYLITSLLLHEFAARGAIDLVAFWGRRARRLFPAVAVVILFALLATLTIARDDLGRTRADALSALVYLTNWHEIIASHSYFNQFGRPSLLQHLWSLAVEEQFYLFWPLLLLLGLRRLHPRTVISLTALLAVASCALMWILYNPNGDPSAVYYGTDTRAFTLLIGALLAFAWPSAQTALRRWKHSSTAVDAVGVVALLGVLALFVRVQDFDPWLYRGGFLLMAVVGAVLVAAASEPDTRLGRVLGWSPLRWLGARSYGIYLWHWPIMQLTRPQIDVPLNGVPLILLQGAATLAAAALSYRYVEMPVRSGEAEKRLRAFLDGHTPHQRLAWVTGTAAALMTFAGLGFGLPAPVAAAAFKSTATPAALQILPSARPGPGPGPLLPSLPGSPPSGAPSSGAPPTALATSARLAQYRAAGRLPDTVIVQIGDNGAVWYADMQHLRRVLKGVQHVVLVNVRIARSWQNEVNSELKSYARTWPQAVLANWYTHSSQAMLTDGVHPSIAARAVYSRVVVDALKVSLRKGA
jgi:peptidoglycan/LPS O-acetylase OafA/YrhL